ncbi:MAG: hypothetical protein ACREQV_07985, partial [Candidatus Binatia bacterium]
MASSVGGEDLLLERSARCGTAISVYFFLARAYLTSAISFRQWPKLVGLVNAVSFLAIIAILIIMDVPAVTDAMKEEARFW